MTTPSDLPLAVALPLADLELALTERVDASTSSLAVMMMQLHAGLRANPDSALLLSDHQIGLVSKAYRTASGIAIAAAAPKKATASAAQKKLIVAGDF